MNWRWMVVAGVLAAATLVPAYSGLQGQEEPYPLLGKPAPQVLLDLVDGGKFNLAEHKGKDIVVMDFWATWCPPCRASMPIMIEITDKYKAKGVVFYGVNVGDEVDGVKEFLQKTGLKFNVAMDLKNEAASNYGARLIPMSVIVGKDGTIQAAHLGLAPDFPQRFAKELDSLVEGKNLVSAEKKPEPQKAEEAKPPEKK